MPALSIIVPVYNVEKYLGNLIDSVLNQSYKDWELILVDDGSTDTSYQIAFGYSERFSNIQVIQRENGGPSAARNMGLQAASGTYVSLIDSDDFLQSDYYSKMMQKAQERNADLVICGHEDVDADGNHLEYRIPSHNLEWARWGVDTCWKYIVKRELLEKNNIHFLEGIYCEDNIFSLEVAKVAYCVEVVPECLYKYYLRNGGSVSQRLHRNFEKSPESRGRFLQAYREAYDLVTNTKEQRKYILFAALRMYYAMLSTYFLGNTYKELLVEYRLLNKELKSYFPEYRKFVINLSFLRDEERSISRYMVWSSLFFDKLHLYKVYLLFVNFVLKRTYRRGKKNN